MITVVAHARVSRTSEPARELRGLRGEAVTALLPTRRATPRPGPMAASTRIASAWVGGSASWAVSFEDAEQIGPIGLDDSKRARTIVARGRKNIG